MTGRANTPVDNPPRHGSAETRDDPTSHSTAKNPASAPTSTGSREQSPSGARADIHPWAAQPPQLRLSTLNLLDPRRFHKTGSGKIGPRHPPSVTTPQKVNRKIKKEGFVNNRLGNPFATEVGTPQIDLPLLETIARRIENPPGGKLLHGSRSLKCHHWRPPFELRKEFSETPIHSSSFLRFFAGWAKPSSQS